MTKTDFTPTTPPLARPVHYTCRYQSPLGGITIAADSEGLTGLWFDGQKYFAATLSPACESRPLPLFEETRRASPAGAKLPATRANIIKPDKICFLISLTNPFF